MGDRTGIEWTDATWNPVTGCDRTSPGCDNCYALTQAGRLKLMGNPRYQNDGDLRTSGPGFGVTLHDDMLDRPLRWQRPRHIFVNSMSDLFHPDVPDEFIASVFKVMVEAEQHVFQVLTKRSARLARLADRLPWPRNVWIGVSVETDRYAYRARHLQEVRQAAVRFVSAEPLLGPLDSLPLDELDWLIVGGESGVGHREMREEWAADLRDRCVASGVPFFFKQWGGIRSKSGGCLLQGEEWKQMPDTASVPAAAVGKAR